MHAHSFRTDEGRAQYLATYNEILALWPVPYESKFVPTSHGTTHVLVCGPEGAPPLVLLHAYAFSAASWYAQVGALAAGHRVYAVDVMGDMTQTLQTRHFKNRTETAQWLRELLDALGIQKTVMAGHSYGGWLTLNFALCAPERVERIALLAPASTFVPMVWHFNLRRITTPTLLLIGEHEVIYDLQKAMARATRLLPNVQAKIIPGASHCLTIEQPDAINNALVSFVG